jgi:TRAP-type C4-dicarboxylate transport system substrate-binding protein
LRKAVGILMRTKEGREALLELIETTGVWNHTSATTYEETLKAIGKRSVGVQVIQALLTDEHNSFTLMMSERYIRSQVKEKGEENDD